MFILCSGITLEMVLSNLKWNPVKVFLLIRQKGISIDIC